MTQDDRIDQVLGLMLSLAAGNLDARLETGTRREPLDGVIEGLNMLAEELSASMTALKRSEESFRSLIERSPDAIFVHRADSLVYANATALALLGVREASDLGGCSIPPLLCAAPEGGMKRAGQLTRRDGSQLDVDVASISVNFDGLPATLSIARDISAHKELTARAMEMDRMIAVGTLAAGVGHEINTPLAYVIGNLDLALQELAAANGVARREVSLAPRSDLRQILKDARDGAERVREIVRDLRTFSSTQATDELTFELTPVLGSAIQMAQNEIRHRARLVRDFRDVPMVSGSPSRLGQVFLNLLVNAAHAIPVGSADAHTITVRVSSEGKEEVRVEVSDTGIGIERDHLARVFDAFFTTKPTGHGTGLGLFVCKRIVGEHGGRIEVRSEPGRGSTFSVLLPARADAPRQVAHVASPLPALPRRVRVLVVDDEPRIARGLARALRREHDVSTLSSAREALKCLTESDSFDAVLCDVMMPEMTGVDLHRELERLRPEIARRVLFFTGGAFTPSTQEFVRRMADRCLEKPFNLAEVRQKLAKISLPD